jgi:hypothetical protein
LFIACFQSYVFSKGKTDKKELITTESGCKSHTASLKDKKYLINEESVIDYRSKKAATVSVLNITTKRLGSIPTDCNDLNTSKEKNAIDPSLLVSISGGKFILGKNLYIDLISNDPTSTIYYTLDGSTPTITSTSIVNRIQLYITSTTTLKVFVRNIDGISSAIRTEVYTFVAQPPFVIYFKKPSNWGTDVKVYYDEGTTVAWPGVTMVHDCTDNSIDVSDLSDGLYYVQLRFENGEEHIQKIIKK